MVWEDVARNTVSRDGVCPFFLRLPAEIEVHPEWKGDNGIGWRGFALSNRSDWIGSEGNDEENRRAAETHFRAYEAA